MADFGEDDLLRALDESVMRWCSESDPADRVFHGGVIDADSPTDAELAAAWENHGRMEGRDPESLGSLVFRNPSWDHIPPEYGRKAAPTRNEPRTVLPFAPFRHVRYADGAPATVLLSHWKGPVEGGKFLPPGAGIQITDALAEMFMSMSAAYGRRSGWRGYSCRDDMVSEALLKLVNGGLGFNPLKSNRPKGYLNRVMESAFVDELNAHKRVWDHEFAAGDAIDEAVFEDGGESGLKDALAEEGWAGASDREFDEAERAWRAK